MIGPLTTGGGVSTGAPFHVPFGGWGFSHTSGQLHYSAAIQNAAFPTFDESRQKNKHSISVRFANVLENPS